VDRLWVRGDVTFCEFSVFSEYSIVLILDVGVTTIGNFLLEKRNEESEQHA